jgi:ATP-dependent DNA helicase RecG
MREAMASAGLLAPKIRQTGFYTIVFERPAGMGGNKLVEKGVEYLTQKTTQKTTQKIIEAITEKSDITQKELAAVIGITEDGVKYHIARLRKKGLLKRIGPDKGGHWEIVED